MASNKQEKKLYFTAGPAKIPEEVMRQAHEELLDYKNLDMSILEMSHRSKEFEAIVDEAEANLRKLLQVPDEFGILFMHGGAKTQFSSVPMNLCSELNKCSLDYIVSGSWSKMAAAEAEKYANVSKQITEGGKFVRQPERGELVEDKNAVYRFYCDNETIQGVEFKYVPNCCDSAGRSIPLVCDMTSNFLTRPIDVSKFGVIFAGAQKTCGIAGLVIVIVRKDLLGKHMKITPSIQNYQLIHENKSLLNTPLTFAIYMANLCFIWMLKRGGLTAMDAFCKEKSNILYDLIDSSGGFYTSPVAVSSRSRTNVVFLLANKELDANFLEESKAANLFELKGHRSVGGFRASLYHGITVEDVKRLAKFMCDFQQKYKS